jgi:threonine/homoserine/homoserine lactone efflux protein
MLDSNFLAYCGVAALLVLSPGATMAVVADAAVAAGRRAGLWTVAGVIAANSSLALASAFGLAAVVHRFPRLLTVLSVVGGLYLAWLGVKALRRAFGPGDTGPKPCAATERESTGPKPCAAGEGHSVSGVCTERDSVSAQRGRASRVARGLITNYSNPSVVLFYTVVVPQFIRPTESFVPRYLLLGGTHVGMALVWLCAFAISVGTLAERMTRPAVRRTMDAITAAALVGCAVKILSGLPRV